MKTKSKLIRAGVVFQKPWERLSRYEKTGICYLVDSDLIPIVLEEHPAALANIDLEIDGELWELKNVTNASSSAGNQLRRVRKKWWKLKLASPMRVVFTTEDATDSYEVIREALRIRMRATDIFILFAQDGTIEYI